MWIVGAGLVKDEIGGRTGNGNGVNQQKHRIQRNGIKVLPGNGREVEGRRYP